MIRQVVDPAFLQQQLHQVREAIAARGELAEATTAAAGVVPDPVPGDVTATVLAALPLEHIGPPSSGGMTMAGDGAEVPFIGRDPAIALLQTAMEDRLHSHHDASIEHQAIDSFAELSAVPSVATWLKDAQFTTTDPRWVTEIAKAMLERLAKGNHPFNPVPAERKIADDARIVVVGDWGSGLPRARAVGRWMAEEVSEALGEGRQAHVVHLGDVYYSGDPGEYDRRLLADGLWPVTTEQATAGVASWSLNGNHDMYSGGWGYFDHLLTEPRFANQRSPDGNGTSVFHLKSRSWDFVGLDTAWDPDPLAMGHRAVLEGAQGELVARVSDDAAQAGRKLVLFSHHQLLSVYSPNDLGKVLPGKLAGVLNRDRVAGWFWGHEHRCMAFANSGGVRFPRCVGHGGIPVIGHPLDAPVPTPGIWEERGFVDDDGTHWGRFGFAILDLAGSEIRVRYRNDLGEPVQAPEVIA